MTGFFPWVLRFQGSFILEHDQYFIPSYCQIVFHWMDAPHFILLKIYLFISGCVASLLLLRFFSSCSEWGLLCSCSTWTSHCSSFSCCRAWTLEHLLSSCGTRAQLLCSMWESSWTRDWTHVSCIHRWIRYHWVTRGAPPHFIYLFIIWGTYELFHFCVTVDNTTMKDFGF